MKGMMNSVIDKRLREALHEDIGGGDVTTRLLIPPRRTGQAHLISHSSGILCGIEVAERCFSLTHKNTRFGAGLADGAHLAPGDVIAIIKGSLRALFSAERVALNLLCHLSGIATLTKAFVEKVSPFGTRIYDTRKTTPLWREVEKYAVRVGGGHNHRLDLAGACFVKDNHIDACGGMRATLERLFTRRQIPRPVIVEARTVPEVRIASRFPIDILLLDNMSPGNVKRALEIVPAECQVEVSGGVTLKNVATYARTGVPRISIGALTHSVKSLDIAMDYADVNIF